MATSTFPWDLLKAESLRSVCRDLKRSTTGRRDEMITFLQVVETQGVEEALKLEVKPMPEPTAEDTTIADPTVVASPKRKREPVVSDYQTRHRDKRVRVISDPGPRRKAARTVGNIPTTSLTPVRKPKARRPKAAPKNLVPSRTERRTIFDGVVLPKFVSFSSKGKDNTAVAVPEVAVSEEHPAPENEIIQGLEQPRPDSSLASSNKENEGTFEAPEVATNGPDSGDVEPVPDDTESAQSSQRVLEDLVNAVAQIADENLDAEGEMVTELEQERVEILVREDVHLFEYPQAAQLGPEDARNLEQVLTSALGNAETL